MLVSRIVHVFLAAMFSLAILAVTPSRAAEFKEYNASAVAAAQAAGRPILLDVSASWCPVCASQNATIKQTVGAAAYAKLIIFHIDFDSQEAVWKGYSVVRQATLIGFKGRNEVGRLEFVTDKGQIKSLLDTVVS